MKAIFLLAATSLAACASSPPRVGEVSSSAATLAVALETGCEGEASDTISLRGAELRGDRLLLDVAHGGGCAEHSYRVCGAREVLDTEPAQWQLTVLHDGHGDRCRARVFRVLEVPITGHRPVDVSTLNGRSVTILVK